MRQTLFLSLSLLFCMPLWSQDRQFEPEISPGPNLNPEYLQKQEALAKEYRRLVKAEIPYESMTAEQKKLMENELFYEAGPYSTETLGCSWYCATGPSGFDASSELPASRVSSYSSENLHDYDLRTAWVEGKEDYGIGEEIQVSFKLEANLKVTHIDIYNGYCKSESAWKANSRVKTFALYANGKYLGDLNLADTYKKQRFEVGSFGGKEQPDVTFSLKILDVYKGTKYKDTAISEINFDGTGDH